MRTNAVASVKPEERKKLSGNVLIGKDILELVSGAMYVEPLTVIREYVQNAVDSIDEAKAAGLYDGSDAPRIDIFIDLTERRLRIRDNGIGIKRREFEERLTAFGGSRKRSTRARGFRGVGRLSALGYCQELVFRSKAEGESHVSEMIWNGQQFKEILRDSRYTGDLNEVVREVTEFDFSSDTEDRPRFFEVELRRVARLKNDILLNEEAIERYLAEVGPVPFHPAFRFGGTIQDFLSQHGAAGAYDIFVGIEAPVASDPQQVFRPYNNTFPVSQSRKDRFKNVEFMKFPGLDGGLAAIGWILHHGYHGALPRSEGVKGLRLRSGNIQVGADGILAEVFRESRFNSWVVGEIHVLTPKVIPNGRRDDFEANMHYLEIRGHLAVHAKALTKVCHEKSILRNREKRFAIEKEKIDEKLKLLSRASLPIMIKKKLRKELTLHVQELEKIVMSVRDKKGRRRLERQFKRIQTRAGRNVDEMILRDPLARLPKAKQTAYRHVIQLVFECAPSHPVAGALVSRILTRLARES
jgi:Histidine kinase-, DNA gyrase B-, and HSP90-like ATPase